MALFKKHAADPDYFNECGCSENGHSPSFEKLNQSKRIQMQSVTRSWDQPPTVLSLSKEMPYIYIVKDRKRKIIQAPSLCRTQLVSLFALPLYNSSCEQSIKRRRSVNATNTKELQQNEVHDHFKGKKYTFTSSLGSADSALSSAALISESESSSASSASASSSSSSI